MSLYLYFIKLRSEKSEPQVVEVCDGKIIIILLFLMQVIPKEINLDCSPLRSVQFQLSLKGKNGDTQRYIGSTHQKSRFKEMVLRKTISTVIYAISYTELNCER